MREVSAEASLAAHFGISETRSESKSSELGKEKAEEGTTSESIAIEFDAEPRSNYLISITKENEQTRQPFDINGRDGFRHHHSATEQILAEHRELPLPSER